MKKIFFLKTCDSCRKILKYWNPSDEIELREIKQHPIEEGELDQLAKLVGGYEGLFNKRAKKYKELGMKNENLSENEWRRAILSEYTFLKRPILVLEDVVYAGNSGKNVEAAYQALHGE